MHQRMSKFGKGPSLRAAMTRSKGIGAVAAFLVIAAALTLLDLSWYEDSTSTPGEPEDIIVTRASQLDDPVGFKAFWMQQQGYSAKSSIEAVRRQRHSSQQQKLDAQKRQPGVVCENTCFKVSAACSADSSRSRVRGHHEGRTAETSVWWMKLKVGLLVGVRTQITVIIWLAVACAMACMLSCSDPSSPTPPPLTPHTPPYRPMMAYVMRGAGAT